MRVDHDGVLTSVADGPLEGVVVIECSGTVSGAYAGRMLRDLGATVFRIDTPIDVIVRDDRRALAAATYMLDHDKAMIDAGDLDKIRTICGQANVLLIDDAPEVSDIVSVLRTWIGTEAIVASTFSMAVPRSRGESAPGSGLTACAWAGISIVIGSQERAPLTLPFNLPEYEAGANLAAAVALALYLRRLSPEGQVPSDVSVVCSEVLAYYCGMIAANYIPYERPWRREGRRAAQSGGVYPLGIFQCRDGLVTLLCRTPAEWVALLHAMGNPPWSKDAKFSDPRVIARLYADEADAYLVPWVAKLSIEEVISAARASGVPAAQIRSVSEALCDVQLEHRGFFQNSEESPVPRVPGLAYHLLEMHRDGTPIDFAINKKAEGRTPLHGLRVLDFSWVWSGPMVTSILADFGAEVIKVEHTRHLDPARLRGRATRNGTAVEGPEFEATPYFNQMNHGKRSVLVDITSVEGQTQLRELAKSCDVVVENMRPGVLGKYGLDYASLSEVNPRLVMLSMSMAGQEGPLRDLKGYASIMSGMAGLESLVGYSENEADVVGMLTPALGDPNAAAHAAAVLFASLYRTAASGSGCWIDLSQIEAMLGILRGPIAEAQLFEKVRVYGNGHPCHVPYGHFPSAADDRWVAISVMNDAQWRSLCEAAGSDEPLRKMGWMDELTRRERRGDVEAAVRGWTSKWLPGALVELLLEVRVPASLVQSYEEMVAALRSQAPEVCVDLDHPYLGKQPTFMVPWRIDGRLAGSHMRAPMLGEDTQRIIGDGVGGVVPDGLDRMAGRDR